MIDEGCWKFLFYFWIFGWDLCVLRVRGMIWNLTLPLSLTTPKPSQQTSNVKSQKTKICKCSFRTNSISIPFPPNPPTHLLPLSPRNPRVANEVKAIIRGGQCLPPLLSIACVQHKLLSIPYIIYLLLNNSCFSIPHMWLESLPSI